MNNNQRAFLKWAGGKYRLSIEIRKFLPPQSTQRVCFVEPFVGAGSVFLNTHYDRYLLADINPDLINLFNTIKQDVERYITQSKLIFLSPNANTALYYYAKRQEFNHSTDIFHRSVLFLYLNRFGFNGLCRYNKQNEYNVPFGRYKKPYFPEKELRFFAAKAQKAQFICANFEHIFEYIYQNPDNYIVYCDPPYAPLEQESNFTHYASGGFSLAQQELLAKHAKQAQQKQIPVLISNHDTAFTRKIYHGAQIKKIKVQRSIGKNAKSRIKVNELLALFS
ncbi:Dam family site-specific DNA-(adenine-N6)-methyltransferase [[Haemophilus] ducreyi]|uniref:Dam family site-specific DNA-(adenine-N6)-methyltransferase n=1 Tax=Haemophilus ducreyi TaxID=730 RepID=UPI0006553166|nr:Dam family site-specific DNA-(adenine-N6)-methyltransferase [[Haemophilus] ducreyi]AKO44999.1 DNA adenine methylase [[Haemophilus] ducreyi]AKO46402.1 DNA adenine methylase [[Haemophilus] ducreyi]AKO47747.1 DNA adenine methylase [[Haemophilus] ducreyi]AKO49129.1 DNA adenine methylase [[Haemophilus] ducreyi]ANF62189.1 DNA adenine methylase [[Haemophilus] ducreyi]